MEDWPPIVTELEREDLAFLRDLWSRPEVMRFADEFPRLRRWSRTTEGPRAWEAYRKWRSELGPLYTQLIVRLPDGVPIGESFMAPLPEGFRIGHWRKPHGVSTVMGDIKLIPEQWGRGVGTEGMRAVVRFAFTQTDIDLFVVPPHVHGNPGAVRVYEKVGFVPTFERSDSGRPAGHRIMELWRARFDELAAAPRRHRETSGRGGI